MKRRSRIRVVKSAYRCNGCGGDHGRYFHGEKLNTIPAGARGKLLGRESDDNLIIQLENGMRVNLHPDEFAYASISRFDQILQEFPAIQELGQHIVFEMARDSPVFLVDGQIYALGDAHTSKKQDHFCDEGQLHSIEHVGDHVMLDQLFLNRESSTIDAIALRYVQESKKGLSGLQVDDEDLDIPQCIVKQVFPYLRQRQAEKRVAELIGVDADIDGPNEPSNQEAITRHLEEIVSRVSLEVEEHIKNIEKDVPQERSRREGLLDELFDYSPPETYVGETLLETAVQGKNIALFANAAFDLNPMSRREGTYLQIGGKKFALSAREVDLDEFEFESGEPVRINENAAQRYVVIRPGMQGAVTGKQLVEESLYEVSFRNFEGDGPESAPVLVNVHKSCLESLLDMPNEVEEGYLVALSKKIRIDALKTHLSREKVSELIMQQNAEILTVRGKREHAEENFGFTCDETGNYYVFLTVPAFAIESQFDGNYYLFDTSRVGIRVRKKENRLTYDSALVAIDNNNHPFLHNKKGAFAEFCTGHQDFPTDGDTVGDVIAKRLRRCKEMVMYGYTRDDYMDSYKLKDNGYFDQNRISIEQLDELDVPIIKGGKR